MGMVIVRRQWRRSAVMASRVSRLRRSWQRTCPSTARLRSACSAESDQQGRQPRVVDGARQQRRRLRVPGLAQPRAMQHRPHGQLLHPGPRRPFAASPRPTLRSTSVRGGSPSRSARPGCVRRATRRGPPSRLVRERASSRSAMARSGSPVASAQQGQPTGRDPLPARVADLAGPRERLLEAGVAAATSVAPGQQHVRPGAPAATARRTASARAQPLSTAARRCSSAASRSPRRRPTRPSIDSPKASRRGSPTSREACDRTLEQGARPRVVGPVARDRAEVGHRLRRGPTATPLPPPAPGRAAARRGRSGPAGSRRSRARRGHAPRLRGRPGRSRSAPPR